MYHAPLDMQWENQELKAFTLHQANINLVQCDMWVEEIVAILTD